MVLLFVSRDFHNFRQTRRSDNDESTLKFAGGVATDVGVGIFLVLRAGCLLKR